jgi:hypothetical protein
MHPSICSLESEPRPWIYFDSPLCEAWFHCKVQAPAKELRFGVEDSIPQNRHGMGVRRSPLYFACDKTRDGKGNYGANLNEILSQDKCLQAQYLRTRNPGGQRESRVGISSRAKFFPLRWRAVYRTYPRESYIRFDTIRPVEKWFSREVLRDWGREPAINKREFSFVVEKSARR